MSPGLLTLPTKNKVLEKGSFPRFKKNENKILLYLFVY